MSVSAIAAAAVLGLAAPATAAPAAGCSGLQLFYNSNQAGSSACYVNGTDNFAGGVFTTPGTGQGQGVKNNAASATNHKTFTGATWPTARIFFNSNWGGVYDDVEASSSRNLSNTYNNNASLEWVL
ncbi:peptidase M23 [Streptomyces sp. NBC_01727]|uniref:peptidase M23 n=1 Tax=Streptomyces sp. NBC_01727 TaxID=2975924 RepID=UPI002E1167E3|nr:peptidase M23 [Streptomyces sp. NBC_01727]